MLIKGNNDKKLKFLKIIFYVVDDKKVKRRQSRLTTFYRYFLDLTTQPVSPFSDSRENVNESSQQNNRSQANENHNYRDPITDSQLLHSPVVVIIQGVLSQTKFISES